MGPAYTCTAPWLLVDWFQIDDVKVRTYFVDTLCAHDV